MTRILFTIIFLIFSFGAFSATQLYLDSPLINISLPEIELNKDEIRHANPCTNLQGHVSCFNDVLNKQILVVYPLTITSNGVSNVSPAYLNIDFINEEMFQSFQEVQLLYLGNPVNSPLKFTSNGAHNYQIRFKIKYKGPASHGEPKVRINFSLVESQI